MILKRIKIKSLNKINKYNKLFLPVWKVHKTLKKEIIWKMILIQMISLTMNRSGKKKRMTMLMKMKITLN